MRRATEIDRHLPKAFDSFVVFDKFLPKMSKKFFHLMVELGC